MGQRANFEETYTGPTFQGSYIAGVYYPDKTKVGWWKNGYPEYFAKVLNAPNFIGIKVIVNQEELDLHTCKKVFNFKRELNMKEGWLSRTFDATLKNGLEIRVSSLRFLSLSKDELCAIKYNVTPLNSDAEITFTPFIDGGIANEDSNWDDKFWNINEVIQEGKLSFLTANTVKTNFHTCTFMQSKVFLNDECQECEMTKFTSESFVSNSYSTIVKIGDTFEIQKYAGYTVDRNYSKTELISAAKDVLFNSTAKGFDKLLEAILGRYLGNG